MWWFWGVASDAITLWGVRLDLGDEHDRGRRLGRFLEHATQPLFGFAVCRAHDLGAVDQEEFGRALVGDGARAPRLAGAGRAVEQHPLGRIDAEPLESFEIGRPSCRESGWQYV